MFGRFAFGGLIAILLQVTFLVAPTVAQDCLPDEVVKLLGSAGTEGDLFGYSVSLSDDVMLVGAIGHDAPGSLGGAAYIYRFDGAFWVEEAVLSGSKGLEGDAFGDAVAISGDVAVVGAPFDDDHGKASGSAYIFRFDGETWNEEAFLFLEDGVNADYFGDAVAIYDNVIVVGVEGYTRERWITGAAFVYRYDGSSWVRETMLFSPDGKELAYRFGTAVSIFENTIMIGDPLISNDIFSRDGAAYSFEFDGVSWTSKAKLVASDAGDDGAFGISVSLADGVVLIGSADNANGDKVGAAYVFRLDESDWVEEGKLLASDGVALDYFGQDLAISGGMAVIGSVGDDEYGDRTGAAYVFSFDGSTWTEDAKIIAIDGKEWGHFGGAISLSGDTVVIGMYYDDENGENSGSAYVYHIDPEYCAALTVLPAPLIGGKAGRFQMTDGIPKARAILAYSTNGLGSTYVPFMDVILDLNRPKQAGGLRLTDGVGFVEWALPIPKGVVGFNLWFQVIQDEYKTNVVATSVVRQ